MSVTSRLITVPQIFVRVHSAERRNQSYTAHGRNDQSGVEMSHRRRKKSFVVSLSSLNLLP